MTYGWYNIKKIKYTQLFHVVLIYFSLIWNHAIWKKNIWVELASAWFLIYTWDIEPGGCYKLRFYKQKVCICETDETAWKLGYAIFSVPGYFKVFRSMLENSH